MKAKEIKATDDKSRAEKKREILKELVKLRAQIALGTSLKNPGQVRKLKRTMARILTVENEHTAKKSEVSTQG